MKKIYLYIVLFLFLLGCSLFSQSEEEKKINIMVESLRDPSLAPETYKIGPGDMIMLDLWGNINATYNLVVSQDGSIFIPKYDGAISGGISPLQGGYQIVSSSDVIPSLGEIDAEGLTIHELRDRIQERVKKYFRGVESRVVLSGLRSISVSIHGSVRQPGVYAITPLYRLTNFIELSGGGISVTGSYRNVIVTDMEGCSDTFDLYEFIYKGDMDSNPYLKRGDRVVIPQAEMTVRITGRVIQTGNYELKKGERLKDLIEISGGFQKRGSLTRSIKIYNISNPDSVIEIDPYKLLIEDDTESNIELRTGDVVSVPMEPFTVTVVGQVTQGGTFEYEPGADFNYYLGLAGGYGERANEGDIRITRWDGTRLKWKKEVEIKPGDTIVIGRSELKGWRDYLEVGLNAANLLFIIWTVSTR